MSTVISIMDEDSWNGRTDNIVVVEPVERQILWIPRDLWSKTVNNRINIAFRTGGHRLLIECLREYDIKVESSICFKRSATINSCQNLRVWVPVVRIMKFWYPLNPTKPIKEGKKSITFTSDGELLAGERIHQWMGARISFDDRGGDLNRIERHKILIRRLLAQNFDFKKLICDPDRFSTYGASVFEDLKQVSLDWSFETFGPLLHAKYGRRLVLVKTSRFHPKPILKNMLSLMNTVLNKYTKAR